MRTTTIPTTRVVYKDGSKGRINECDFDPKVHKHDKGEAEAAPAAKPAPAVPTKKVGAPKGAKK